MGFTGIITFDLGDFWDITDGVGITGGLGDELPGCHWRDEVVGRGGGHNEGPES